MKDLKISVNKETRYVNLAKTVIGVDGENLQEKIVFSFEDEFVDGTARLEYENTDGKQYVLLEKENETYTIPVKSVITKKGNIKMQLVITEGTDEENIPVFKSNQFYLWCEEAINAVDEAPDSYELWIETANEKLNEVDNLDIDLVEEDKKTKITITRKDGTTKEAIIAGGDKGVSNYKQLEDLPTINGVKLLDNKTTEDLGIIEDVNAYIEEHKEELRGPQGLPGEQGLPGQDGYTPVKGVDYFDGEPGQPGESGPQGEPGTTIYSELNDKPKINGVELIGDKTSKELNIEGAVIITALDEEEVVRKKLLSAVNEEYAIIKPLFFSEQYQLLNLTRVEGIDEGIKFTFVTTWMTVGETDGIFSAYDLEITIPYDENEPLIWGGGNSMDIMDINGINTLIDEKITSVLEADY